MLIKHSISFFSSVIFCVNMIDNFGHIMLLPHSKTATNTHTFKPVAVQVVVQLLGDHMGWQMASYQAAQCLNETIRSNQY